MWLFNTHQLATIKNKCCTPHQLDFKTISMAITMAIPKRFKITLKLTITITAVI